MYRFRSSTSCSTLWQDRSSRMMSRVSTASCYSYFGDQTLPQSQSQLDAMPAQDLQTNAYCFVIECDESLQ